MHKNASGGKIWLLKDNQRLFRRVRTQKERSMHWGDYGPGMGMGFGWLFMIVFWGLVISVVFFIVQAISGRAGTGQKGESALDILEKRYAKGEITKEEFEKIRNDLTKK